MITRKLPITSISDYAFVEDKQHNYSYAFRLLYKMTDECEDKEFVGIFKEKFSLNNTEYVSILTQVKAKRKQEEAQNKKRLDRIDELTKVIEDEKSTKRQKFKAFRNRAYHMRRIGKEPTFGGLSVQKRLTKECNKEVRDEEKIEKLRKEFHDKRVMPFCITGEANQKGNRFFDLSRLPGEGVIVYKPFKGKKIEIQTIVPRHWSSELYKLEEMASKDEISVTVSLSTNHIYLTFDEQALHGYSVDEKTRRKEVKEIKSLRLVKEVQKAQITDLYRKYYEEQRERMAEGKIKDRCIAIDINPTNVGYCILDKDGDDARVIHCGWYDMYKLTCKHGFKSDSDEAKHLNNKRKYEISMVVKGLFKKAAHYRCSVFCMEDVNFKGKSGNHEFNRLTKNVWNRCLWENLIQRRCNESGIELRLINPAYTSFIGNIKYPYVDATNASIEIGRRGFWWKIKNGSFYPHITSEDIRTLEAKFGHVDGCDTSCSWIELYKSSKAQFDNADFSYRLRTGIDEVKVPFRSFSLNSYKSGTLCTLFTTL